MTTKTTRTWAELETGRLNGSCYIFVHIDIALLSLSLSLVLFPLNTHDLGVCVYVYKQSTDVLHRHTTRVLVLFCSRLITAALFTFAFFNIP